MKEDFGDEKGEPLAIYTDFHSELPFLELDYIASAKCRYLHFAPLNGKSSSKKGTFDANRYR
jgi:hypothetical protein